MSLFDEPATVVLVTAATGFGKTTMLEEWAKQRTSTTGWLTLSAEDNDPVRLTGVFDGETTRPGPHSPRSDETSALVLEGTHVLIDDRCIALPNDAIANLIPQAKLIISGCRSLPLRLARFRSLGRVREVLGADLHLTLPEAHALLGSRAADDGPTRDLIRTLMGRHQDSGHCPTRAASRGEWVYPLSWPLPTRVEPDRQLAQARMWISDDGCRPGWKPV